MKRECEVCGREYEAKRSTSQVCGSTCRTRKSRQPKPATNPGPAPAAAPANGAELADLVAMTQARLAEVERDQTVLGSLALILAGRLASGAVDTGSSIASLSKELRATIAAATEGAQTESDLVDELEERRARKLASIRGAG